MAHRPSPLVSIFLPDLRGGGAEKLHLSLAQYWLEKGVGVDFVLMRAAGELLPNVPAGAHITSLEASRTISSLAPAVRYLRDSRPAAVLVAMWPLTTAVVMAAALARSPARIVVSEHNNMTAQYAGWGKIHNLAMRASMAWTYRHADAVVAVSDGVARDIGRLAFVERDKIDVIFNPACVGNTRSDRGADQMVGRVILSVGSLKEQKNHELLIRAFARLAAGFDDYKLRILGEGGLRPHLEALVLELGLSGSVELPGFVHDVASEYQKADLFVLSSDYEGFGNVVVEALEQGTPVVSTDCPSGPREILEDGKYGTLVPVGDVEALAKAMDGALSLEHDREALKRRAQDFSVDKAADAYLDLLLPGWRSGAAE